MDFSLTSKLLFGVDLKMSLKIENEKLIFDNRYHPIKHISSIKIVSEPDSGRCSD